MMYELFYLCMVFVWYFIVYHYGCYHIFYLFDSHIDVENFTISSFMFYPDSQQSWNCNVFFIGPLGSFCMQAFRIYGSVFVIECF